MEYNVHAEERKRFLRFFRVWLVIVAILLVVWAILAITHKSDADSKERNNPNSPTQRVYDYAGILSDKEEEDLNKVIEAAQIKGTCDIILVIIGEPMGTTDSQWNRNMMNYADDFYDNGQFGYNAPYGDGALILDNWYEDEYGSQGGTWLSTSGKMEDIIGTYEEDSILDALYDYIDSNPAKGYEAAIKKIAFWGEEGYGNHRAQLPWQAIVGIPAIIALIFAAVNLHQTPGKDTTTATTYVEGGHPHMRRQSDDFLRKSVTSVRIQTDSGSSSGRSHSGGGSAGHHTSSGGHSHGGGGRRR